MKTKQNYDYHSTVLVLDLATGAEEYYMLSPVEALISAAIVRDKRTGNLTDQRTRDQYRARILFGTHSASLGDLAVKL